MKQPTLSLAYLPRSSNLLLCLVFLLSSVFAQEDANLVGKWKSIDTDVPITLILKSDGTGSLDSAGITYTVAGNKLVVNENGVVKTYTVNLYGNIFTATGGDLPQPLRFERQGTASATGLDARRNQIPENETSSDIVGAWERNVGQEVWRLVLNPDGTGTLRGQSLTWKFNHGVLSLSGKGTILTYNATVTGNSLQLSGGSLQQPVVYDRVKSGSGLIGRWQNKEATLEIKGNGSVVINGETFRYTVHGDVITLSGTDGSVEIPFQLDGDTLITTFNGQRNVYARAAGSDSIGEGSGGSHPSELAGKWCYMSNVNANNGGSMSNRCITLYADGTYQYHSESSSSGQYGSTASEESDNGTWSATGTTITANSRNHGTLTYRLEKRNHPKTGDPMIVLDGDAYVTSTQRTPWQ